jgi:UDP-2,3-diacylglucosamine pyrophosphatase LpxH
MEQAYIIVSDLHLGSKESNHEEFCSFLEWIRSLATQSGIIKCKDKEITIKNPSEILLLGDILELWDPDNGDRDNVIKDSIKLFSLLFDLNCEKIYVVGNHDEYLGELDKIIGRQLLANGTSFDIYNRHYPEKDEKSGIPNGIKIGNRSYFFLHGHQFDKEQAILAYVSKLIGERWDPLDWFQILYNIPFTKKHWTTNFFVFLALLLGGKHFLWNVFLQSSFWLTVLWAAITGFFALSSIPGIVAYSQRWVYSLTNPRDKTTEQIIKEGYYQEDKDTINADVVVFGHTHFASSYELLKASRKKLFLNTGSWVGIDKVINGKIRYANTFIYLDETGSYILTWRGSGNINCIEAFT